MTPHGDGYGVSRKSGSCYNHGSKPLKMKRIKHSKGVVIWKCPECAQEVIFTESTDGNFNNPPIIRSTE